MWQWNHAPPRAAAQSSFGSKHADGETKNMSTRITRGGGDGGSKGSCTGLGPIFVLLTFLASAAISFLAGGLARYYYPVGQSHIFQDSEKTCAAHHSNDAVPASAAEDVESDTSPAWKQVSMTLNDMDGGCDSLKQVELIITNGVNEWVDHLLSHHCHSDGSDRDNQHHCVGLLERGGHVAVSSVPGGEMPGQKRTVHFLYSGGSRPIRDGTPRAVFDFVVAVERLVLGKDAVEQVDIGGLFTQWGYRSRVKHFDGSDFNEFSTDPFVSDLELRYLSQGSIRVRHVASSQSAFQKIDVVDLIDPRKTSLEGYRKSLVADSDGTSYEAAHPEMYRPNRIVFLDGVEQSMSMGDEAYHEALVHPGLFAHPHPRRAAIIGGGEGATLREILKHDTISHVKMIEIDEIMVQDSIRYLQAWSSCSDVIGSTENCFDDPRADVVYEDAMAWFVDRFVTVEEHARIDASDTSEDEEDGDAYDKTGDLLATVEPFDFIVMDALDPDDNVDFAKLLYTDEAFFQALYNGLSDDGVLALQLSYTPWAHEPPEDLGVLRETVKVALQQLGFERMYEYSESHCGFLEPWTFLVACKSADSCHDNIGLSNPALRDVSFHKRMRRTKSGESILRHVDSSTLTFYEVPHRSHEDAFCKTSNAPIDCVVGRGYDPGHARYNLAGNTTFEHFVTGPGGDVSGDGAGVGKVFAKVNIPKGSYVHSGNPIFLGHGASLENINNLMDFGIQAMIQNQHKNKFSGFFNPGIISAVSTTTSFADANVGDLATYVSQEKGCSSLAPKGQCHAPRNIVVDRHLATYGTGMMLALRNISAGEEIVFG